MTTDRVQELRDIAARGESQTVEFRNTTAQLPRAGETLCGMLNSDGGVVLIGVSASGELQGQDVSDSTQQEIARMLDRFQPTAPIELQIALLPDLRRSVILLEVPSGSDGAPYTDDGRAWQRTGTTTSRMPQDQYERLLMQRQHARRRWENQPAVGVTLDDLDHEEILRTREDAIRFRRISAGTSRDVGDILDRLGLRHDGQITQAAQVLYGLRFLPDYPQVRVKMGRFRGTKITGDILDNKQQFLHAFAVVREAMAFLDRTLPLSGHFVTGRIQREDRLPVPADALREVILNAVMHRDYSNPGGDISIAVFDDRIEISSYGNLLPGVTPELLSGPHKSILRNPLIAQTFHRTGAVKTWGRGTNRVIEVCREHGVEPPVFELQSHCVVVRFPVKVGPTPQVTPQVTPQDAPQDVVPEVQSPLSSKVIAILAAAMEPRNLAELQLAAGLKDRKNFRLKHLEPLVDIGWLQMTIPDKPRSSLQRYVLTGEGRTVLSLARPK